VAAGYNVYGPAARPADIDYGTLLAHVAPGAATVDLAGLALAEDADWWFAVRCESSAGVEETHTDRVVRVRISGGVLVGPPPNGLVTASARAVAAGRIELAYYYRSTGQLAAPASVQVARVVAGVIDWSSLVQTVALLADRTHRVTLDDTWADGESVQLAVRAVTSASVAGPHTVLDAVSADASAPAAVDYLTGAQA